MDAVFGVFFCTFIVRVFNYLFMVFGFRPLMNRLLCLRISELYHFPTMLLFGSLLIQSCD